MEPKQLWKATKEYAGITKSDYDNYFANREVGYAYKLGKINKFAEPRELGYYGIFFAPQSFVYISLT